MINLEKYYQKSNKKVKIKHKFIFKKSQLIKINKLNLSFFIYIFKRKRKRSISNFCFQRMKNRQHRCLFYLLKLNKKEYDEFQTNNNYYDMLIQKYQNQLNISSNKLTTYESIINQIFNIIKPVSQYKEPKSIIKFIEDAYLSKSTKENSLILIKKYIKYCNTKIQSKIESIHNNDDELNNPSLYEVENTYEFIIKKNNNIIEIL